MTRPSIRTCLIFSVSLVPLPFMPTVVSAAPSFDCSKASTPAEKLICDVKLDETLAARDNELATLYKRVLSGSGRDRAAIVSAQSQWLRKRDADCMQSAKPRDQQVTCLAEQYDQRIAALKPLQAGAPESLALCHRMVDQYKTALQAQSDRHDRPTGILPTLKGSPDAGFEIADSTEVASRTHTGSPTAEDYVKQHFNPDAALRQKLREGSEDGGLVESDAIWLTRLPKTDVHAISTMNGTMRCETIEMLFDAGKTEATEIPVPGGGGEGECSAATFAAIGNQPALILGDYVDAVTPKTYHLVQGHSIYPWKDGWQPACNISLTYAPHLSYPGRADAPGEAANEKTCPNGDTACVSLYEAVLALMVRYKQDPEQRPMELIAELSAEQRRHFLALRAASDAQASGKPEDRWETGNFVSLPSDASGTDALALSYKPAALPLVHEGKVLLVLAGHMTTTGSRDMSDYNVWLKEMVEDKATFVTTMTVTLSYGALRTVKVSLR